VIRTGWRAGGVPRGEIRKKSSVSKGQIKYYRAMIGGEREAGIDPGSIEERKQLR